MIMRLRPKGDRGCAYLRVSYGDTEDNGFRSHQDPAAQRTMILKWAERHGVMISRWYTDTEGRNPRDMAHKRKDFQRLIEDVQAGLWDWVAVDSQDRIDPADSAEMGYYITIFRRNDCELWSVDASQGKDGLLTSADMGAVFSTTVHSVTSAADLKERGKRQVSRKREHAAKGEWQGGYIPYGFDVVCLDNRTNREVWRVVVMKMIPTKGIWQRVIVYPNLEGGKEPRQERCDGKDAFPKKQDWERLELAPSMIVERVEIAQEIFKLYASGAWSVRGLCDWLNKRHIDPVTGEGWYHTRLLPMLRNPTYHVGQTVWGKKSHGKNAWYVGGEYLIPPRRKGKPLTGRKNNVEDWVFPKAGTAIITKDLFGEVQSRLDGRPEFKRGLRDERLWLAGLLVCDRCGQKMSGWSQGGLHYYCTTYGKYGKANATGCRCHRVQQAMIEEHVGQYLRDIGSTVQALVETNGTPALLDELVARINGHDEEFIRIETEIRAFLEARGVWTDHQSGLSLSGLYREFFDRERLDMEHLLAQATAELHNLMLNMNRIEPDRTEAVAIQNRLIAEADRKVKELKDRLVPLDDKLEAAYWAVVALDSAITDAEEALVGEDARRKALALRKVVQEVRLTFRHYEHHCRDRRAKAETLPRSSLEWVEFVPVHGEPRRYRAQPLTVDSLPGPG